MKNTLRHTLLILALPLSLYAGGQFYTVEYGKETYSLCDSIPIANTVAGSIGKAGEKDAHSSRNKWVDQYLSVSLPLKQVHITSEFGNRKDPFSGKTMQHNGLDLRAHFEDVYSMLPGTIEKVGFDDRSGHYVKIRHADYTVTYCHLSAIHVRRGQTVRAGEIVGATGNSGRSTDPHLHYSLKYKGRHVNPRILIDYIHRLRQEAIAALTSVNSSR